MNSAAPRILADHLKLPESCRWRAGEIWFVNGSRVQKITCGGELKTHAELDCPVLLGLSFTPQGDMLTSDSLRRRVFRISSSGETSLFADLSEHTPYMLNEPMWLSDGSVVVGDIGFDVLGGAAPQAAAMLRIRPDGTVHRSGPPLWFSNGLISLDDGRALLAAETIGGRIRRLRLHDNGLDEGQVLATVDAQGLDGIALTDDGSLWCADIETGRVIRMDPEGREAQRLPTGFPNATSCVVAGQELVVTVLRKRPTADLNCDGALIALPLRGL